MKKRPLYPVKLYFKKKQIWIPTVIAIAINSISVLWIFLNIKPTEESVFLHYTILFGADLIGPWWKLFYMPLAAAIITIINVFLGWFYYKRDPFISSVLIMIAIVCQAIALLSTVVLVAFNI